QTSDSASADLQEPWIGRSVVEDPDMGLLKPAKVESGSAPKRANVGLFECRPTGAMYLLVGG
ncbi:hypothetical protein H663_010825, partial [Limnohabitans planktonicus II-D5]